MNLIYEKDFLNSAHGPVTTEFFTLQENMFIKHQTVNDLNIYKWSEHEVKLYKKYDGIIGSEICHKTETMASFFAIKHTGERCSIHFSLNPDAPEFISLPEDGCDAHCCAEGTFILTHTGVSFYNQKGKAWHCEMNRPRKLVALGDSILILAHANDQISTCGDDDFSLTREDDSDWTCVPIFLNAVGEKYESQILFRHDNGEHHLHVSQKANEVSIIGAYKLKLRGDAYYGKVNLKVGKPPCCEKWTIFDEFESKRIQNHLFNKVVTVDYDLPEHLPKQIWTCTDFSNIDRPEIMKPFIYSYKDFKLGWVFNDIVFLNDKSMILTELRAVEKPANQSKLFIRLSHLSSMGQVLYKNEYPGEPINFFVSKNAFFLSLKSNQSQSCKIDSLHIFEL